MEFWELGEWSTCTYKRVRATEGRACGMKEILKLCQVIDFLSDDVYVCLVLGRRKILT